jgi:Tol biopolymer transport system component
LRRRSNQLPVLALCLLVLAACGGSADAPGRGSAPSPQAAAASYNAFLLTGEVDLFEITLPANQRRLLLHLDDFSIFDASVSSDGRRLAFVVAPVFKPGRTDYGTDVYIAGRDGSGARAAVLHAPPSPSVRQEVLRWPLWLPDGQTLLFQVQSISAAGVPTARVESIAVSNGKRSVLIEGASTPSLSADGRTLIYLTGDVASTQGVWLLNLASGDRRQVIQSGPQIGYFGRAVLSPDGSRIAVTAASFGTTSRLPASAGTSRLAKPALAAGPLVSVTDGFPEDLWLVNADGSGLRRLAAFAEDSPSIAWSADGRAIYLLGASGLWVVNADSGARRRLAEGVYHGQLAPAPSLR